MLDYKSYLPLILFLSLLCETAFSKSYNCKFKVGPTVEEFNFDTVRHRSGTGGSYKDFVYFIGMKKTEISVKIQNSKTAAQVQSNYSESKDELELALTPGWDLKCVVEIPLKEKIVEVKKKPLLLDDITPLSKYKAGLRFKANTAIKIHYNVSTAKNRMRAVVFQKGRLFTTDDDVKRDLNGNWCIFQMNLELDQDTMIEEGHIWQTVQYNTLKNSESHTVYAWSFVDPAQGKVTQKFKRYVPFNMACQIKSGEVFNRKMWREITGDRIKLYYNP